MGIGWNGPAVERGRYRPELACPGALLGYPSHRSGVERPERRAARHGQAGQREVVPRRTLFFAGAFAFRTAILLPGHWGGVRLPHRARFRGERSAMRGKSNQQARQQQDVNKRSHRALKMTAGIVEVNSARLRPRLQPAVNVGVQERPSSLPLAPKGDLLLDYCQPRRARRGDRPNPQAMGAQGDRRDRPPPARSTSPPLVQRPLRQIAPDAVRDTTSTP